MMKKIPFYTVASAESFYVKFVSFKYDPRVCLLKKKLSINPFLHYTQKYLFCNTFEGFLADLAQSFLPHS
jgi:hypothetical protein